MIFSAKRKDIKLKIGAWSGSIAWVTSHLHTHKCYPTTGWCGCFWLLSFLPRPIRISLDNLVSSSSQELTILTPALVRTPNQHAKMLIELPNSDHPQDSSPPVAWVTDSATKSSYLKTLSFNIYSEITMKVNNMYIKTTKYCMCLRQRPYHIEHTSSRPITVVKQCWAQLVLG